MSYIREWDSSCPRVWDKWEQNGSVWVIQDLPPEEREAAVELMKVNQLPDEYLAKTCGIHEDPEATAIFCEVYKKYLSHNTSLACYKIEGDKKILAGVNICFIEYDVLNEQKKKELQFENERMMNLVNAYYLMVERYNNSEILGVKSILSAIGLCVAREYRGAKLGARILNAREPLCRHLGVSVTSSLLFTGLASQKLAERCGFSVLWDFKVAQYAEAGITCFSKHDETVFKEMYKRYD